MDAGDAAADAGPACRGRGGGVSHPAAALPSFQSARRTSGLWRRRPCYAVAAAADTSVHVRWTLVLQWWRGRSWLPASQVGRVRSLVSHRREPGVAHCAGWRRGANSAAALCGSPSVPFSTRRRCVNSFSVPSHSAGPTQSQTTARRPSTLPRGLRWRHFRDP